jgi:DnaJ-class molecular chaperone
LANDPYQELGVSRSASQDDLRKAFRKLAKQHHPDANPGNKTSEEKFKRVTAAFDIVGDPAKRAKFDRGELDADGRESHPGFGGGPGGFSGGGFRRGGPTMGPDIDLSDIFGDVFGGRGGGRGFGSTPPQRGQDVRARLDVDLEDAILGAKRRIAFSDGRTLDVAIPAGATDGQTLRLKGQGAPGQPGRDGRPGPAGDALIEISIRPHPVFRRESDGLVMDLPVSVPDAVLGGKVEAQTPEGPVTLSVPAGSNTGSTLRLKGRGLATAPGKRGDLLARIVVTLPDKPDPELVKFAESWRKDRPYSPSKRR